MSYLGMSRIYGNNFLPTGLIDDVKVMFTHHKNVPIKKLINRWNYLKDTIQWSNLLFIIRDPIGALPYDCEKAFSKIKYPHLLIKTNNIYPSLFNDDVVYILTERLFATPYGNIMETYFDIVGWFNNKFANN